MNKIIYPAAFTVLIASSAFSLFHNMNLEIADGYSIKFISKDPTGVFTSLKGTVQFHEAHPDAATFDVSVDVKSINTGNGMQNKHAVSDKWFDADKFPEITFQSKGASKTANGYETKGKLTLHGITRDFSMPFTFERSPSGGVFESKFKINRNDFNLGDPNNNKVPAELDVELRVPVNEKHR